MESPQKATQQQTKSYNSRLVLKTIYDQGRVPGQGCSRADVARITNLTRTTVSDIVAELQEKGLVEEIGYGQSMGGRSPILLSVVDNARHLVSIDLGMAGATPEGYPAVRGAVVNLRNEVISTASLPIESRGGGDALALVYELIDRLVAGTRAEQLLGIGIGTPGLVDTANGVVLRAVNLDWRDLPLGGLLNERYGLPVYIANDSQLVALAQYMFGGQGSRSLDSRSEEPAAKKYQGNMVVIKVGHGIGAGIILNGSLFQGDGYGAGEIGHITVVENGSQCRCGNFGCLETVASVPSVLKRANALAQSTPSSLLNAFATPGEGITLMSVHRAFSARDAAARQLVLEVGRYLGMAAANLVGTLNVRHVVISSDLAIFGTALLEVIRQEMLRRALPPLAENTHLDLIESHPDVVILGASALLLTQELGLSLAR